LNKYQVDGEAVGLPISAPTTAPISILNHNVTIVETDTSLTQTAYNYTTGPAVGDMIYYRGKLRSHTALDSRVRPYVPGSDGVRYATFAFELSANLVSRLNIILRGVDGGIDYVNELASSAITVGGIMPGLYYRFVSGSGTGPDYSSRWISANTTEGPDVSSSEYNNSSVSMYNGLLTSSFSSSEITFNVFAPNIVYNPAKTTTLFITIKTPAAQNMSFSRIDYN
jgi:hypothetical protein